MTSARWMTEGEINTADSLRQRAVDRAIAETLGYRMQRVDKGYWQNSFELLSAVSQRVKVNGRYKKLLTTEENTAWGMALGASSCIPFWQTDLNEALRLVEKHTPGLVSFVVRYAPGEFADRMYACDIKRHIDDEYETTEGLWFGKPALAVCISWLEAVGSTKVGIPHD